MQNNTQESWEERFEKIWREFEIENAYEYDNSFVKSFIHALLSKQAEEISEAVEQERERIKQGILSLNQTQSSRHDWSISVEDIIDFLQAKIK